MTTPFVNDRRSRGRPVRARAGLLAAAVASLLVATALPAGAAETRDVTRSTVRHAGAAISGPLEGAEGEFFIALEGFAFTAEGESGTNVVADAFFGSVECLTAGSDADVRIARNLRTATVSGTVTGSCFDFTQEKSSSYTASFQVTWRGTGRLDKQRIVTREEGQVCVSKLRARDANASGTLTWSAPELGIGGTGTPFGAAGLTASRDRCHSVPPSEPE